MSDSNVLTGKKWWGFGLDKDEIELAESEGVGADEYFIHTFLYQSRESAQKAIDVLDIRDIHGIPIEPKEISIKMYKDKELTKPL